VGRPINKCEAQGRLGVVAGEGKSLIHRSGCGSFGIDGVDQRRVRIHLRNIGLYVNESDQRNVWQFMITPDKRLVDKRLVRSFEGYGFDGMRCEVDGNLLSAGSARER
jgi:hypothetical protein